MKPRFSKWEWLILALVLGVLLSALMGCQRGSLPGANSPGVHGGPGVIITRIGAIALTFGSAGLVVCAVLAWSPISKRFLLQLAVACATLIAAGAALHFIGKHIGALVICAVLGVICYLACRHLGRLEKFFGIDLNRNGRLG